METTLEIAATTHFIGGKSYSTVHENLLDVISPWTGEIIGAVPIATESTIEAAIEAAQEGFKVWGNTSVKNRVQVLFKFKQLVEENMAELSALCAAENGKTVAEAKAEIEKGIEVVEYATSLPQILGQSVVEVSSGVDCQTKRFPLGVVVGITPFNFPAMVPMWMFPIALACGNSFILKASEQVPLTPVKLAELLKQAGLPDGAFNVVHGDKVAVNLLLESPEVKAVGFVGSSKIAKYVYEKGTLTGKRVLAMGGAKNHLVVMPDADPELTAKNVMASANGCAGQRCMAASVLLMVKGSEPILEKIQSEIQAIRTGIDMGAVISQVAKERIEGYITRAEAKGAKLLVDGRNVVVEGKENGFYVGPTLIDGVQASDECACDEIFGPVLSVVHVDNLDEALAIENANPYGNAAAIYTSNGGTARYFSERASAGMIGVNVGVPVPREPFSFGGWNDSRFGVGDITGEDAIKFWTQTKKITTKWEVSAAKNWMS
jgi:malonate-semialdehyde dehydrogenase (acetylating) / methylmalonate-semialdehyde dehydrogenase